MPKRNPRLELWALNEDNTWEPYPVIGGTLTSVIVPLAPRDADHVRAGLSLHPCRTVALDRAGLLKRGSYSWGGVDQMVHTTEGRDAFDTWFGKFVAAIRAGDEEARIRLITRGVA